MFQTSRNEACSCQLLQPTNICLCTAPAPARDNWREPEHPRSGPHSGAWGLSSPTSPRVWQAVGEAHEEEVRVQHQQHGRTGPGHPPAHPAGRAHLSVRGKCGKLIRADQTPNQPGWLEQMNSLVLSCLEGGLLANGSMRDPARGQPLTQQALTLASRDTQQEGQAWLKCVQSSAAGTQRRPWLLSAA